MDFLILRPLPPKTGYHFFEGGGWGGGGWGGGQKFLLNRLQAVGTHDAVDTDSDPMVTQPTPDLQASVRTLAYSFRRRRRRRQSGQTGVRTADHRDADRLHYHSATAWITAKGLPAAWGRVCH